MDVVGGGALGVGGAGPVEPLRVGDARDHRRRRPPVAVVGRRPGLVLPVHEVVVLRALDFVLDVSLGVDRVDEVRVRPLHANRLDRRDVVQLKRQLRVAVRRGELPLRRVRVVEHLQRLLKRRRHRHVVGIPPLQDLHQWLRRRVRRRLSSELDEVAEGLRRRPDEAAARGPVARFDGHRVEGHHFVQHLLRRLEVVVALRRRPLRPRRRPRRRRVLLRRRHVGDEPRPGPQRDETQTHDHRLRRAQPRRSRRFLRRRRTHPLTQPRDVPLEPRTPKARLLQNERTN
mmetsp:Transcript_34302/g.110157  ORF Transcript_34302/g.110157 Transcript_34302/m.110157 type:complete len:287 (+) Transcript_34302:921-1781(+)